MRKLSVSILDYGLGNPDSVKNMIRKFGVSVNVTCEKDAIEFSDLLIIPGVGNFGRGMHNLQELDLIGSLNKRRNISKLPILGICLGMQLFFNSSEEGNCAGLGWIEGSVTRFIGKDFNIKVPHMGWNIVKVKNHSALFIDTDEELRYYFVHSYHANCLDDSDIIACANYGYEFVCAVKKDVVTGVQFHPEKSHIYGYRFFERYLSLM